MNSKQLGSHMSKKIQYEKPETIDPVKMKEAVDAKRKRDLISWLAPCYHRWVDAGEPKRT